jgi:hypothetical protein
MINALLLEPIVLLLEARSHSVGARLLCQSDVARGVKSSSGPEQRIKFVTADMRDDVFLKRALAGIARVIDIAAAKADEPESEDVTVFPDVTYAAPSGG